MGCLAPLMSGAGAPVSLGNDLKQRRLFQASAMEDPHVPDSLKDASNCILDEKRLILVRPFGQSSTNHDPVNKNFSLGDYSLEWQETNRRAVKLFATLGK